MKDRRDPPVRTEEQALAEHEARVLEYIRLQPGHVCEQPRNRCSDCPYRANGQPRKIPPGRKKSENPRES